MHEYEIWRLQFLGPIQKLGVYILPVRLLSLKELYLLYT